MTDATLYTRFVHPRLIEALGDTPVVLVHGPRQCGKTTLARQVGDAAGYAYFSFDDDVLLASARADPVGFAADLPDKSVLDEVQRAPEVFTSLKVAVDRDRRPGRFILTGSANVLLVSKLADSLAGRIEFLRLHPFAQVELALNRSGFLDKLFGKGFKARARPRLGRELAERIVAGGYPAALARSSPRRRAAWYRDYIETLVQRDVRDLARISAVDALPRLLRLAAGQTARLLNVADLAAPFQLSRPTIRDYVTLLTRVFLLDDLPPWHSNRLSRLIKTPKLHPTRGLRVRCSAWTLPRWRPIAICWVNCWRPSSFRSCVVRRAGMRPPSGSITSATRIVQRSISSSNAAGDRWPVSKSKRRPR